MRWTRYLRALSVVLMAASQFMAPLLPAQAAEPRPAMIAARAATSTLIDVAYTGERYVAVGDRGHILLSEDGQNWRQVESPVSRMLTAVYFVDAKTGWAVGYDFAVLKTTDGGNSWQLQNYEPEPGWPFYDVFFLNAQRGFALGERGSFRVTDDGGTSWQDIETDLTELGMHLNAMTRLPNGVLVMVGEKGVVASSVDEGVNWVMLTEPYVGSFFGVLPKGENGFITFGLRGNTYVADDISVLTPQDPLEWDEYGRETITEDDRLSEMGWRYLQPPIVESLFGGSPLPGGGNILVGVNGSILRTNPEATQLSVVDNPADSTLGNAVATGSNVVLVGVAGIAHIKLQ